jgi:prepilin-type N-terminal cleavage/methylation domain-containing protein
MRQLMNHARVRRGFSIIEMLIALTITATLLTAALAALDASFKGYKQATDTASTNVVSRLVMHRMMSLIRTGRNFGPFPADVFDTTANPVRSTFVEFEAFNDPDTLKSRSVRLERRAATGGRPGPFEMWYVQKDFTNSTETASEERPLISGLTDLEFTLEYDIGPQLRQATVDMTVQPQDLKDTQVHSSITANTIRFVSSVNPRNLSE